jgi:hypothetical protein
MRLRTAATAGAVAILVMLALAGCGGSGTSASPETLLRQAKATLDATNAVHFALATSGGGGGSLTLVSGEGDLGRPDMLKGTFKVEVAGVPASVNVASANGTFLAQLPFSSSYQRTDPSSFGFADPAKLISPSGGLSSILTAMQSPRATGQTRVGGEVLDEVSGTVPGTALSGLPDDDPSKPVQVQARIDPSNRQLRQIILTGPIGTSGQATYTVTLTGYGEHVDLALPPT